MDDELYYVVEIDTPIGEDHPVMSIRVGTTTASPEAAGNERYLDETELEAIASKLEDDLNNPAQGRDESK